MLRFETIIEDSDYLLRYLQRNDPEESHITFEHSRSIRSDVNKTASVFKNVNKKTIEKLTQIYWNDFKIMGHDIP